jgi:F-type H+-transporting ATPase subunit b
MELFGSPEFWVLVAFIIFVVLVAKPVSRMITASLDQRSARIKTTLDEAQRLRDEAQQLLAENQRRQRDAAKEAADILAHARDEAARLKREAISHFEAATARREKLALEKIAQAETAATAEVRREAVEVATAATRKLLAQVLTDERATTLVDQSIKELDRKLH